MLRPRLEHEKNVGKSKGFNFQRKGTAKWKIGLDGKLSRGKERAPVLLEEPENAVRAHGINSCNTDAYACSVNKLSSSGC
jgi:hypothetical protein